VSARAAGARGAAARPGRRRRNLRLAVVCYPTFGGSGVVATELGLALAERGHQVHVISTEFPARLRIIDGLSFHRVPVVTYPLFQYPPYTLALATKVAQVIRQERLDLVHAHYAIPHSVAVFLGQQMGGCEVRTVTTLHGTDVQLVGLDPSYWEITRFGMLRSSGLTAVSQSLADTTQREFHLDREVRVIPNFVDTRRFARPRDSRKRREIARPAEKVLLHVSNFRPVKRVWEVVEVFSRIAGRLPAQLYLIGDGPDRPRAEATARDLGLESRVHCLKTIGNVEEWYGAADLLLHPSEMESFGLAPLEAMACGVPVLAYRVGGLPEVVEDGASGHLLEVGDVEGMARRGIELLTDERLWAAFSRRARRIAVQRFAREQIVDRYERYFLEVLGR
jgi:N-acetyl-alpha-D-glucosaminyl L-malate synthase BshA